LTLYLAGVSAVAVLAGAVASVSGFGIGSLLIPLFAVRIGTRLAVAAASVPHLAATALRLWILRAHVERRLLWSFGLTSAAGGLAGALLNAYANRSALTVVFGALLVTTGVSGLSGLSGRLRLRGWVAWVAGAISGMLGGLVGNQGGIRSAAMLGLDVPRHAFVATATAVALIVDGARTPVYLWMQPREMAALWPVLLCGSIGTVAGTLIGARMLGRVPESIHRRLVSALVLALGIFMFFRVED